MMKDRSRIRVKFRGTKNILQVYRSFLDVSLIPIINCTNRLSGVFPTLVRENLELC
jgi:hypothetical protein